MKKVGGPLSQHKPLQIVQKERKAMNIEIEHVQLQFLKEISNNVCSLQVSANIMCFALKTGHLFLIDLATPSNVVRFQVPMLNTNQEKLLKMWMDTSGVTILVKTNFAKYYICHVGAIMDEHKHKDKKKITPLKKLSKKNCDVTTIEWCSSTSFICGTKEGKVYLVGSSHRDPSVTKLYTSTHAIDGISWSENVGALLVSGSTIMFWKTAKDPVTTIAKTPPDETERFEHLDKDVGNKFAFYRDTFAWITQSAIVFGRTDVEKVLTSAKILLDVELPASKHRIKDILLTDYHILLLRGPEIIVINQLNDRIVFQEAIWNQDNEKLIGLTADYTQEPPTFWCYSTANIYEIILQNESSGVWKLLCESGKFEEALNLSGLSSLEKEYIYQQQADVFVSDGRYSEAAEAYGLTSCSTVGSVALKFIEHDKIEALQAFLKAKLNHLTKTSNNQVPCILLSSWIVWNYMQQLNTIDDNINTEPNVSTLEEWHSTKKVIEKSFQEFVRDNLGCLDNETIYQIISNQNRKRQLLFFAELIEDYEYVLSYWIRLENWYEALKVLVTLQSAGSVYNCATVLLVNSPDATVNTWMQIKGVNPVELIQPILTYFTNYQKQRKLAGTNKPMQNYALNYLKWCIDEQRCREAIVHNTALYMMITGFEEEEKEHEIIKFMELYNNIFDIDFILRLSLKFKKFGCAIYLYSQLKLYEDAVSLALEKGMLESAKLVASTPELAEDYNLGRKLWLRIARFLISQGNDIKQTIKTIIQDSNEVLTIKDLLPLFNEFTTIANLKEELVKSLEKHSHAMSQVSQEIKDSTKIKKEIAQDIKIFRQRYQVLEPGASCDSCRKVLQTRKFYVFPCGHSFHTDCLIKEILRSTDFNLKSKIENFQRKLTRSRNSVNVEELDKLLSTKCCLCSDIKINIIDEPFTEDYTEAARWAI